MSELQKIIFHNHLWGCAIGWGSKADQKDIEFQERWCDCGIMQARAQLAALESERLRDKETIAKLREAAAPIAEQVRQQDDGEGACIPTGWEDEFRAIAAVLAETEPK